MKIDVVKRSQKKIPSGKQKLLDFNGNVIKDEGTCTQQM